MTMQLLEKSKIPVCQVFFLLRISIMAFFFFQVAQWTSQACFVFSAGTQSMGKDITEVEKHANIH